jgi:hypothetical protein
MSGSTISHWKYNSRKDIDIIANTNLLTIKESMSNMENI